MKKYNPCEFDEKTVATIYLAEGYSERESDLDLFPIAYFDNLEEAREALDDSAHGGEVVKLKWDSKEESWEPRDCESCAACDSCDRVICDRGPVYSVDRH